MKKKIIYGLLLAVSMVTASSSFVSCKDYEGDNYAELRERDASLAQVLEQQKIALQNCSTNCANQRQLLQNQLNNLENKVTALTTKEKADSLLLRNLINGLDTRIGTVENALNNYVTLTKFTTDSTEFMRLITANQLAAAAAQALAERDSIRLDSLDAKYETLKTNYNTLNTNFNTFINAWGTDLNAAIAEVARVRALISVAKEDTAAWNLAAIQSKEALESLNAYQATWNKAVEVADNAWNWINKGQAVDRNGKTFNSLQDLIKAFEAADDHLQGQIDALNMRVDSLKQDIQNILGTLKKQITGVIIQAAYSPVLGNGSLPFGIQTNLLAAYAGKATKEVDYFPSVYDEDYADSTTVLTSGDEAYLRSLGFWPEIDRPLKKGDYIISDKAGNAGKLYVTVNPTNVDFTGTNFDLVNSKGQVSLMTLENLNGCDEVLNFGWTRSANVDKASSTGFYVANATVAKEDIAALSANVNTKMFEKAFKEELNSMKNGTALVSYSAAMDLARAVYSSLEPLQRFGVRAQWEDTLGIRSYTSAFDIAATVVAPLGFGFTIPDSKYTRFPVFNTEYLKNKFHIKGDFSLQVIKDKETAEKKIWLVVLNSFLVGSEWNADHTTLEGYHCYEQQGYVYIDVTPLYQEVYGDLETALTPYQDVVAQANKRIDWVVSYIDRYNKYATKANKFIRNANNLLQPVLLWCDGQNFGQLGGMVSGNYAVGTIVPAGGAVALVPTTYTLELLAPAYKKSVICTNVYKNGQTAQQGVSEMETALKNVNEALKAGKFDLFEGQSLKNEFIFEAKSEYEGMTFEFAYTALDYAGKIAGRKFYLTVGAAK